MPKLYQRLSLLAILLLLLLSAAPAAQAAEPRSGDRVTIPASETVDDDVYLFGQTITIDGTVKGDAVAVGQTIIVNGTVEGSLMAAGSTITVNGRVGNTVRAGAYAVHLTPQANISRDVLVGAYSLIADPGSQVQNDVWAGSYQARLGGEIGRDYRGSQVALEINGIIHGNADVEINASSGNMVNPAQFMPNDPTARTMPLIPPGLRVGDNAQIGGTLTYTSATPATISPNANIAGGVQMTVDPSAERNRQAAQQAQAEANSPLTHVTNFMRDLVALLLVGLLLMWLARAITEKAAVNVATRPLPSFIGGLVTLIAVPLACLAILLGALIIMGLLSLLTLGSLGVAAGASGLVIIGGLLLVFFTALTWISKVVVGLAVGRLLLSRISPSLTESYVWPMVIGVTLIALVIALLNLLPVLGSLISLLIALLGIGALAVALWESRGGSSAAQPLPPPLTPTPAELPTPS